MKKFIKALPYILAIVLLISNVVVLNRIDDLKWEAQNTRSYISSLESQINNITYSIRNEQEEDRLIQNFNWDIVEIDGDTAKCTVHISLNRLPKDADLFIVYEELEGGDGARYIKMVTDVEPSDEAVTILLQEQGMMKYSCSFLVNKQFSYDLKLVVDGEDEVLSNRVGTIDLYPLFFPQLDIEMHMVEMHGKGRITYSTNLHVFTDNKADVFVEKAICTLKVNEEVVDTFDLIEEGEQDAFKHGDFVNYTNIRKVDIPLEDGETIEPNDITIMGMSVLLSNGIIFEYTNDQY